MVDVGPLLALGGGLAASAVRTFGTTVELARETAGETDPDTLETSITRVVLGSHPAIVVKNGGGVGELAPGVHVQVTDWRLVLLPTVPDVEEDVWVTVTKSRDRKLVGARARVLGGIREGAGVVYTVYARPMIRPAGAP